MHLCERKVKLQLEYAQQVIYLISQIPAYSVLLLATLMPAALMQLGEGKKNNVIVYTVGTS